MFRLTPPSICPFCEVSALLRSRSAPPWQQALSDRRGAATLQKRKPSRMSLSPNVRRGPPPSAAPSGRPIRKSRNSPFGGMNLTEPPREAQYMKRQASAAEQKRADRFASSRPGASRKADREKEPMKALKMQRSLASVSYEARGRIKQELLDRDSFDDFDLLPVIKESIPTQALIGLVDVSPTPIQRLAIPALLGSDDGKRRRRRQQPDKKEVEQFLLAAETGSGKTLAYILPVIDAIKRAETAEAELEQAQAEAAQATAATKKKDGMSLFDLPSPELSTEPDPSTARPRAIILLPTAELVAQVGALVKAFSHTAKFRCAVISAAFTGTVIRSRLFTPNGIDVVISTPHLLSSITESDPNLLSRVSHLVIDEADSLLDRSFAPTTSSLIDRASPSLQQLILCSATIPRSLDSYLHKRFPDIRRLATPNLHAIPRRVQLSVVDIDKVPFQGNRDLACAQTIWEIGKDGYEEEGEEPGSKKEATRVIVFVNEREKTQQLATYLRSKGIDAMAFSRDADERKQAEILANFTGTGMIATPPPKQSAPKVRAALPTDDDNTTTFSPSFLPTPSTPPKPKPISSATSVLITTDITARGIDTLPVRHVVLYDVPHTSIDFIHRLGRVGRMGRRGRGVVLVGKNDRKDVVKEVREGMFRGRALI